MSGTQTIKIIAEKKAEQECGAPNWGEFASYGWCIARTYPEAVTGISTLALAVITLLLVIATKAAANAAKAAAEHIPKVERGYIVARNDEIRDNITRMRREWEAQRGAPAIVRRFNATLSAKGNVWFWPKIAAALTSKHHRLDHQLR